MGLLRRVHAVSLRTKIAVPVAAVILAAFAALAYATSQILDAQRREATRRYALTLTAAIEGSMRSAMLAGEPVHMRQVVEDIARSSELRRIAVRRLDGSYVIDTRGGAGTPAVAPESPEPGRYALRELGEGRESVVRVTTAVPNEKACYACHPKHIRTIGYIEVDKPDAWLRSDIRRTHLLVALAAGVSFVLVWAAVTLAVNTAVLRPLQRLRTAMREVRTGERSVHVQTEFDDEIGQLAGTFNRMVQEVAAAESSLVKKEQQLAKAQKLAGIGLMAAGVAHEINNPLAAASVAAETLQIPSLTEEQRARLAAAVLEGTQRIQEIVSELLTLDSRQGLNASPRRLEEVVNSAFAAVRVPDGVRTEVDLPADLPDVLVDPYRVARAFGNIFKNAVQAMPDGGLLRVEARPAGGCVEVRISDTGVGMEPEVMEHIFDPFFSTREVGAGFGLGLAFAHAVVTQHGGRISVSSRVGEGTSFVVTLPSGKEDRTDA